MIPAGREQQAHLAGAAIEVEPNEQANEQKRRNDQEEAEGQKEHAKFVCSGACLERLFAHALEDKAALLRFEFSEQGLRQRIGMLAPQPDLDGGEIAEP